MGEAEAGIRHPMQKLTVRGKARAVQTPSKCSALRAGGGLGILGALRTCVGSLRSLPNESQ